MPHSALAKLRVVKDDSDRRTVSISEIAEILGIPKKQHSIGIPTYEELDLMIDEYLRWKYSHE